MAVPIFVGLTMIVGLTMTAIVRMKHFDTLSGPRRDKDPTPTSTVIVIL
jgi:hypothetical protein